MEEGSWGYARKYHVPPSSRKAIVFRGNEPNVEACAYNIQGGNKRIVIIFRVEFTEQSREKVFTPVRSIFNKLFHYVYFKPK